MLLVEYYHVFSQSLQGPLLREVLSNDIPITYFTLTANQSLTKLSFSSNCVKLELT